MPDTNTTTDTPAASNEHPHRYTAALADTIEQRWQRRWDADATFHVSNPGETGFDDTRPKFFCMDMFPYPSGAGLHVGHPLGYIATDIVCRHRRMTGHNVLHPMGWDAFGLPAEQYAIQTGVHPATTTRNAIDTFRRQLKRFGFSYDWAREFATIDPDYYRWTQWIWLKAYDAWYDTAADCAKPIADLVHRLENGHLYVGPSGEIVHGGLEGDLEVLVGAPVGCVKWHELDEDDRRAFVDDQRLAYLSEQTVNWCPKLGTALANEEVIDGRSERGGFPVYRRPLKQWMFRITSYAERLLRDLEGLDWPESTRAMQTAWIGRSTGAEIDFPVVGTEGDSIRVYTTRPDTMFGATFMVLAPEHSLVEAILEQPGNEADLDAVRAYIEQARNRSDVDRMAETKDKTGVFTGGYAINPGTGDRVPVWVADYVLMGYGHGAIMAVPAHDQRDYDFARAYGLPTPAVVGPDDAWLDAHGTTADAFAADVSVSDAVFSGSGVAINSANDAVSLNGLPTADAKRTIIAWLDASGRGHAKVNFKLRDWLFSRQRYWGEPFPIVYDDRGNHYPVDASNLPVELPDLRDYEPVESDDPTPLLGKATDWLRTTAGEAGVSPDVLSPDTPVTRETNTMPGWAGSCWYYLRYADPKNAARFASREVEHYWMVSPKLTRRAVDPATPWTAGTHHNAGVDLYIGGAEHAVLHLLYARFWHKILFDFGEVSTPEPFGRLFHQGMITAYAYSRPDKSLVPVDQVTETGEDMYIETATGEAVVPAVTKMSKSLKNVINPDEIIADYGADTFRLYEMYMGPLDASKPWNTRDIVGPFRFLQRLWRLAVDETTGELAACETANPGVERALHRTIAKVGEDVDRLAFNTAIAAMIEFVNVATAAGGCSRDQLERLALVIAPFVPHLAEEMWSRLGHTETISFEPWPAFDAAMLVDDEIEMPVQVMGKVRGRITVPADADAAAVEAIAMADERIQAVLAGKTVRKVIVVPGKIVNVIAG